MRSIAWWLMDVLSLGISEDDRIQRHPRDYSCASTWSVVSGVCVFDSLGCYIDLGVVLVCVSAWLFCDLRLTDLAGAVPCFLVVLWSYIQLGFRFLLFMRGVRVGVCCSA